MPSMSLRMYALAFGIAGTACGGPQVEVRQLGEPDGRTTIGFGGSRPPEAGFETVQLPEPLREVARRTVRDVLISKGYGAAIPPAKPELLLFVGVGKRARKVTDGVQLRDPFLPDFVVDEGSLIFDVFAGEELIYRAAIEGAVKEEPDLDRFAVALRKALAEFPAAGEPPSPDVK